MSSKRRIRRKSCTGKTRYLSFKEAEHAMTGFIRRQSGSDWPLSPYRCKFCNGFHFGHVPLAQIKARAAARLQFLRRGGC